MGSVLQPPVEEEVRTIDGPVGSIAYQGSSASGSRPLVLFHSINAAASTFEMLPVFQAFKAQRPCYLFDLPGFGLSARPAGRYEIRTFVEAMHAAVAEVQRRHDGLPVDAAALSLSSEFLARSVVERPGDYHRIILINPTGFSRGSSRLRSPNATREVPGFELLFERRPWSKPLFNLLTTRTSISFFLKKTFGSDDVDPALVEAAYTTSRQQGAHHAPFSFLSGRLFSRDIRLLYEAFEIPTWVAHGTRGDFKDFSEKAWAESREQWSFNAFDTGAMPHWERGDEFNALASSFLEGS